MVDKYVHGESANTWKFGEDVFTPNISGDAIRYLSDPHLAENKTETGVIGDPDHYSEFVGTNSSSLYIHMNCGIPNKVFLPSK
jgi:bacillolysin/thermolysin